MAADSQFRSALAALAAALDELNAPSMIIGGVAVIAAGVPRETIDIDATVLGRSCELETLVSALYRTLTAEQKQTSSACSCFTSIASI